jgi:hypothetical protein
MTKFLQHLKMSINVLVCPDPLIGIKHFNESSKMVKNNVNTISSGYCFAKYYFYSW